MLTGLVYAAVVILWAVVLVPQWMRRHDRDATRRTTVTFQRAMTTLERQRSRYSASRASHNVDVVVSGARSRVHDRTRVTKSARPGESAIDRHLDLGVDPFEGGEQEEHLRDARLARSRMIARETAMKRRRQVRHSLIGLSVIMLLLYVMGTVPLLAAVLPPLGLAAFWLGTRREAAQPGQARSVAESRGSSRASAGASSRSRSRAGSGSRSRSRSGSGSASGSRSAAGSRASAGARSSAGSRSRSSSSSRTRRYVEPTPATASALAASEGAFEDSEVRLLTDEEIAARRASARADLWEAVDSPLPGYLADGRAGRGRGRSRHRGDWTAERMLEQVEALRTPGADAETELGLDEYIAVPGETEYEHRRAVND